MIHRRGGACCFRSFQTLEPLGICWGRPQGMGESFGNKRRSSGTTYSSCCFSQEWTSQLESGFLGKVRRATKQSRLKRVRSLSSTISHQGLNYFTYYIGYGTNILSFQLLDFFYVIVNWISLYFGKLVDQNEQAFGNYDLSLLYPYKQVNSAIFTFKSKLNP